MAATAPREKWLAEIKQQAADNVAAQLIKESDGLIKQSIQARTTTALTGDAAWRHVATVLDVDKAVQDFQSAVSELGTTVYDPIKAAQKNPVAFAEYMRRSPQLLYLDVLGARGRDSAALHASFPEIPVLTDRKSTRLNSSHVAISYAVFCLKKKRS